MLERDARLLLASDRIGLGGAPLLRAMRAAEQHHRCDAHRDFGHSKVGESGASGASGASELYDGADRRLRVVRPLSLRILLESGLRRLHFQSRRHLVQDLQ